MPHIHGFIDNTTFNYLLTIQDYEVYQEQFIYGKEEQQLWAKGEPTPFALILEGEDIRAFLCLRLTRYWVIPYSTTVLSIISKKKKKWSPSTLDHKKERVHDYIQEEAKSLSSHITEHMPSTFSGSMNKTIEMGGDINMNFWEQSNDIPSNNNYCSMVIPSLPTNFSKSSAGIESSHRSLNFPSTSNLGTEECTHNAETEEWDIYINENDNNVSQPTADEVEQILENHIQDF
ncbi:757_t:CDS:1 [Paraglomus brasilianum]|uniref:757_t:CDS:1 n=1 Tax=Paraglomus brasilianum TaxID=144538 RepID=A0A9N9CIE1_9GLOM|nr:757_t:CDS:1 [Paraglomus brasilianum]